MARRDGGGAPRQARPLAHQLGGGAESGRNGDETLRVYINRRIDRGSAESEAAELDPAQLVNLASQTQRGVVVGRHACLAQGATRHARRCGLPGGPCVTAIIEARSRAVKIRGARGALERFGAVSRGPTRVTAPAGNTPTMRPHPACRQAKPVDRDSVQAPAIPGMEGPYDAARVETHWYDRWEAAGLFAPSDDPAREPFVIAIPPPNITGALAQRPRDVRGLPGSDDSLAPHARTRRALDSGYGPRGHRHTGGDRARAAA